MIWFFFILVYKFLNNATTFDFHEKLVRVIMYLKEQLRKIFGDLSLSSNKAKSFQESNIQPTDGTNRGTSIWSYLPGSTKLWVPQLLRDCR